MALTPEEIEGRQFSIVPRGYDREEVSRFLTEVAASYRYAVHNLLPGVQTTVASPPTDPFAELGEQVADILRATERLAERRRQELDADLAAVRAEAEQLIARTRRDAERDRDQARRTLAQAQERADAIVAEADEEARRRAERIEAEARARAEQVLARARGHEERLREVEQATLGRIQQLRTELQGIVDRFGAGAVLDLRAREPVLHAPGREDSLAARLAERDPVARMVQAAVGRAAEHSASDDEGTAGPDRDDTSTAGGDDALGTGGHPAGRQPGC